MPGTPRGCKRCYYKKIVTGKIWLIPILILVLIGAGLVWYWHYQNKPVEIYEKAGSINQIAIEGVVFEVELATTPQERAKGLADRKELCDQCGMLFIFDKKDYHSFWMRNTLIPLDIIWLDEDWQVVDFIAWAQPQGARSLSDLPVYQPKKMAQFVLEVPGGTTKRIQNFKVGTRAKIN